MMKTKRRILLLMLLIICGALGGWYYLKKDDAANNIIFTEQGQTSIGPGKISLKVWDSEAEDGDSIAVYFNGKLLRDSLAIFNHPENFDIGNLSAGEYLFGVKAISEGTSSPASARISITNGTEEKEFAMDATLDSAASWRIVIQ